MSYSRNLAVYLVFSVMYVWTTVALVCYQCGDSATGGSCQTDTAGMLETNKVTNTTNQTCTEDGKCRYFKHCQEPYNNKCTIARLEQGGEHHWYIRECSDGRPMLASDITVENVTSKNYTVCTVHGDKQQLLYCITLCDGDFCNGPQKSSGVSHGITWFNTVSSLYTCAVMVIVACLK